MKNILMTILVFLFATPLMAQSNNEVASNMTIIRLTILKDNNKILMRNTENGWMTPAIYYTKRQNIKEALDSLANVYGIKISEPTLGGLFTYKYEFKSTSDMRQFYVSNYQKGDLKSPNDKEQVEWMPIEEAISKLSNTVSSLGEQTRQVLNFPSTLWGGSFILNRVNGKLVSKVENEFYPLREDLTSDALKNKTSAIKKKR